MPDVGASAKAATLPRRDWFVVPLLCLVTIGVLLVGTQLIARHFFTESRPFIAACMYGAEDPVLGGHARKNSVCRDKKFETPWVEYRFNGCGHRTTLECGPKAPGEFRIVIIGSSVAMGHVVRLEDTFASSLPGELRARTGRRLEIYNEGMVTLHPHAISRRMDEVLAAQPDLVLWILTPVDVERELPVRADSVTAGFFTKIRLRWNDASATKSRVDAVLDLWDHSRRRIYEEMSDTAVGTMLLHVLYESPTQHLKSYLESEDESGFLKSQPSDEWRERLRYFKEDAGRIAARLRESGIPWAVTMVPTRGQVELITMGQSFNGVDPFQLDGEIAGIVSPLGAVYVPISQDWRKVPDAWDDFYAIDGHPNARGHAELSHILARELTRGAVPALVARGPQISEAGSAMSPNPPAPERH